MIGVMALDPINACISWCRMPPSRQRDKNEGEELDGFRVTEPRKIVGTLQDLLKECVGMVRGRHQRSKMFRKLGATPRMHRSPRLS